VFNARREVEKSLFESTVINNSTTKCSYRRLITPLRPN
jgi:hypothetical protein